MKKVGLFALLLMATQSYSTTQPTLWTRLGSTVVFYYCAGEFLASTRRFIFGLGNVGLEYKSDGQNRQWVATEEYTKSPTLYHLKNILVPDKMGTHQLTTMAILGWIAKQAWNNMWTQRDPKLDKQEKAS